MDEYKNIISTVRTYFAFRDHCTLARDVIFTYVVNYLNCTQHTHPSFFSYVRFYDVRRTWHFGLHYNHHEPFYVYVGTFYMNVSKHFAH